MVLIAGVATVTASESEAVNIDAVGNGFMNAISVDSNVSDSNMGKVVSEENHIDMISEDNGNLTIDAIDYDEIAPSEL